ncbi:MAG TPA: acylneuraminate cytidylyltransferase family protein [Bacteroidia bacterium]|nr:acylneuraminate cytidylyltransferase family protein [Bacteroidia bacterium]
MTKNRILALIPARGGSKAVKKKNIHLLNNKPLIAYSIETALASGIFDKVLVTTDNEEIAGIARDYGAYVPFLRPAELAQDDTTDLPVYKHAITWLQENDQYVPDIIAWLRPTCPLRTPEDIRSAVALLKASSSDWVRSVCEAEHHPYWMYSLDNGKLNSFIENIDLKKYYRRQLLPPVFRLNGAVDVTWRETIMEKNLLYTGNISGYVMPGERSIDIDTILDFALAEQYLKQVAGM